MKPKDNVAITNKLEWPARWKRAETNCRTPGRFRITNDAQPVNGLIAQLQRLGCTQIRITSNRKFEGDTSLTVVGNTPVDPGVAVYFKLHGQDRVLACDRWSSVGANAQAIALHVKALRGQKRWGVGDIEQAFAGYAALPERTGHTDCHDVLGVRATATDDEIKIAYRTLAKKLHPDAGGTTKAMAELNASYQEALSKVQAHCIED